MKNEAVKNGIVSVLGVIGWLIYGAMHIYFTVVAFTQFKVWFAIVTLVVPAGGDLLLVGASAYKGNWTPLIIGAVSILFWLIAGAIAKACDREKEKSPGA